jgi:DNA-binding transcriptional MerR regulator
MKLTIGQVASYVGVTVRAVRHYHQRGLLAEPDRDASGYRRYDAKAVVDLIKIKTLADAGVPLARIKSLLKAEPAELSLAVSQVDQALEARIRDLQEQKRRIAGLVGGDTLFLPPKITELLDRLRAIGVSAHTVQVERDGWIVLAARYADEASDAAQAKLNALAEPDFQRIYLAYDEAAEWDPADPRLEHIADLIVDFAARHDPSPDTSPPPALADDPVTVALLSPPGDMPPAWLRLDELCHEKSLARRLRARGD